MAESHLKLTPMACTGMLPGVGAWPRPRLPNRVEAGWAAQYCERPIASSELNAVTVLI